MVKARKARPPRITAAERAQLAARRLVDHDFGIRIDEFGRERLAKGTAESKREYEVGKIERIVRVRNVDPLIGISTLTNYQREAGRIYRTAYELCEGGTIKPASWDMRVDGSSEGKDRPQRLIDARNRVEAANGALGYGEIQYIVTSICGDGMSIKALAEKDGNPRDVVRKLLEMGLQRLADHFGIVPHAKRVDR